MTSRRFFPWLVWVVGSLFLIYQFLLQTSPSVMVSSWQQDFHLSATQIGLLSSSFFFTYIVMQVPAGILIDKLGPRLLLSVGILICAIAAWSFSQTDQLDHAIVYRMIMGLVAAPAFGSALYLAANWFDPRRFAMIAGFTETLGMFGGFASQACFALTVAHIGWRDTYVAMAILGSLAAILIWLVVRRSPYQHVTSIPHKQPQSSISNIWQSLGKVIGLPQVWLLGLFSGLTFAAISAMGGLWGVPFLLARYDLTPTTAAVVNAMLFAGMGIGSPIMGWLSDRIGKRKPLMLYGTLLNLVFLSLVIYLPGLPWQAMPVLLFFTGVMASVYILPFAVVRELTPRAVQGTAMGFTNMMSILLGSPVLQPLIGRLLDVHAHPASAGKLGTFVTLDYQMAFLVLPLCLLIALVLLKFIRETYCQQSDESVAVVTDRKTAVSFVHSNPPD